MLIIPSITNLNLYYINHKRVAMVVHHSLFRVNKSNTDMKITDISKDVGDIVKRSKVKNGIVNIFVEGSTAAISTAEYDPNLLRDIEKAMERIAPSDAEYEHHRTWGDHNGKSHVRATLVGPSLSLPVENGVIPTGTWQQIILMDFDVPKRTRTVHVQIVGE